MKVPIEQLSWVSCVRMMSSGLMFPNIVGLDHVMRFCTCSFFPNENPPFKKIK